MSDLAPRSIHAGSKKKKTTKKKDSMRLVILPEAPLLNLWNAVLAVLVLTSGISVPHGWQALSLGPEFGSRLAGS